ncbi:MAG: URC4/urg3 family protein [Polyangiaceae bacterium]
MSRASAVATLRSPDTIRTRCHNVLAAGLRGELAWFAVHRDKLGEAARLTAELTRKRYPDLEVPPHSRFGHFEAGGVKRLAALDGALEKLPPAERARSLIDLVVVSVLLDAGAGMRWRYREQGTGATLGRSEGLAIASLAWAKSGALSSKGEPYQVDAQGLSAVTEASLGEAFQVEEGNPLVGVAGRVHLLRALAQTLRDRSDVFGPSARIGGLYDYLSARATGGRLPAPFILAAVLEGLGGIWPGRLSLEGEPLGDVWQHDAAGGDGPSRGYVPFHKLSQWLSYSLLHPLRVGEIEVTDLDRLTGLAEYRNGGLFVDVGVLVAKDPRVTREEHDVASPVIVEWRALTVALLDEIAPLVRTELGLSPNDDRALPLCAVLEGGTWAAGRELAARARSDGGPPIQVRSDGTVF